MLQDVAQDRLTGVVFKVDSNDFQLIRYVTILQTTDVVPMDGYDLPASNIYLVVVPPASQTADEHTQIEQCYLNILNQAVVQGATSIAFPALGSRAASDILKESVAK